MKKDKILTLIEILLTMTVFQCILFLLKQFVMPDNLNQFGIKMFTMFSMMGLTVLVIIWSAIRKIPLSVFPKKFSKGYIIFTVIFAVLFILTPQNFIKGLPAVAVLFYGSVITPIYEELLFRGFIWNKLEKVYTSQTTINIIDAILFGLWHIGYMYTNLMKGDWFAVGSKVAIGLVFGLILGLVRRKAKTCYPTILLHGIMNIFL